MHVNTKKSRIIDEDSAQVKALRAQVDDLKRTIDELKKRQSPTDNKSA